MLGQEIRMTSLAVDIIPELDYQAPALRGLVAHYRRPTPICPGSTTHKGLMARGITCTASDMAGFGSSPGI